MTNIEKHKLMYQEYLKANDAFIKAHDELVYDRHSKEWQEFVKSKIELEKIMVELYHMAKLMQTGALQPNDEYKE